MVLISRQQNTPPVDFLLVQEMIERDFHEYKTVMLTKTIEKGLIHNVGYAFHMFVQMYHLATSKVVFLDSYCIAVSVLAHKKSLYIIQLWHAIGSMKKFGYAMLDKPEGSSSRMASLFKMHHNYNIVTISSFDFEKDYIEGFRIAKDKITQVPLPRTDLLRNKKYKEQEKAKLMQKYAFLADKKTILYAPTFRKDENHLKTALDKLHELIDHTKYNFVVKLHPVSRAGISPELFFMPPESTFEWLFASDFLITDYSSLIYEAGLLSLPTYSYAFDWDSYQNKREFNFDIKNKFPGLFTDDPAKIISAIEKREYDFEYQKDFISKNVAKTSDTSIQMLSKIVKGATQSL